MRSAAHERSVGAIAARLAATREALGLNQRQLCERTGIAPNTYNQWEKAKGRPDLDGAIILCDKFGLTLDWIYLGDESRLPHDMVIGLRRAEKSEVVPAAEKRGGDRSISPQRRGKSTRSRIAGIALALLAPALSACAAVQQAQIQQFNTEAGAVLQECQNKRLAGELRGFVASVRCSNPRLAQLAAIHHVADGDVAALYLARRLEIAERMDAGKLTEAQDQVEMIRAYQEAAETQGARNRAISQERAGQAAVALQGLATAAAIVGAASQPYQLPQTLAVMCSRLDMNTVRCQ